MRHFYSRFTSCIIVENHILRNFFSSGNVRLLNYGFPERNKRIIESIKKNNTTKVFEITYSGRIVAQKGLDRLILAVKELTEGAFMTEVRINVLGKFYDIEYEKKIDLMIKKYDLIDKFEGELGPKEYYQRLLNTNCIFVPSINEGHCNVVQDAIACQTVVGVTTGVKTGNTFKNKRLIAQNDIEGIKNALLYIYNNYEKLSQNYGDVYDIKTVKSIDHFYHAIFEAIEGKYA
jgi:glycosyltransferase involved in cell wall biosynthesis